jgi:NTE family protein
MKILSNCFRHKKVIGSLCAVLLVFMSGCVSSNTNNETSEHNAPKSLTVEDSTAQTQEEYVKEEVWHSLTSINGLTGTWDTPEGLLEFPVEIDGKEYLSITYPESSDSYLWKSYAAENKINIAQLWQNRYVYIPEIYGTNFPVADKNGIQYGIKTELVCILGKYSALIHSYRQLLIPADLVSQNISFFEVSQDKDKIRATGRFRFFSDIFQNLNDSFTVSLNEANKRVGSSSKYGLVLSGGGGKGAYEVGVWKAMQEYGLAQKIRAVSGTSVGGLNSALFSLQDYDQLEELWLTKVPDKLTQDDALISQAGLTNIIESLPLTDLQSMVFPQVYVTAVRNRFILAKLIKSKPGQYATRFNLNSESDVDQIKKKLLATSAFPIVCPSVKLADGYEYSDGGNEAVGGDNTPIDPIADNHPEINNIFIVYLAHEPGRKIKEIDYDTKTLVQIVPSIELGGILDGTTNFTSSRIKLLINYGYEDTVRVLEKNGYYPVSDIWFE